MKKILLVLAFLGFFTIGGCGPIDPVSPIVSGVVMWIEGEAHKYYSNDSATVYRAVKRACAELNYEISRDDPPEEGDYYLLAGSKDRFKINIREVEQDITKLSVRVNFMGDKPYAELLYKKVDAELSTIEFDSNGNPVRNIIKVINKQEETHGLL